MILARLAGKRPAPARHELDFSIIARDSTRARTMSDRQRSSHLDSR